MGHDALENLNISVSGSSEGVYLFSGAVCEENNETYHLDWLNEELNENDEVLIKYSDGAESDTPIKRFKMKGRETSLSGDKYCDFCKRSELDVGKLIATGSTPNICQNCVELCVDIIKGYEK